MLIERPPYLYRLLIPGAVWRMNPHGSRAVYLTFDDGPVPEVTPWVLDVLDRYEIKATFFLVADNVRRYPHLFEEIIGRGHSYGNHTFHHLQGIKVNVDEYIADVKAAGSLIDSPLFRPPHGWLTNAQRKALSQNYRIIMHDLVTRDYNSSLTPERIVGNVKKYVRDGSIIVFHDSRKSERNLRQALEPSIVWLKQNGYEFRPIPMQTPTR